MVLFTSLTLFANDQAVSTKNFSVNIFKHCVLWFQCNCNYLVYSLLMGHASLNYVIIYDCMGTNWYWSYSSLASFELVVSYRHFCFTLGRKTRDCVCHNLCLWCCRHASEHKSYSSTLKHGFSFWNHRGMSWIYLHKCISVLFVLSLNGLQVSSYF